MVERARECAPEPGRRVRAARGAALQPGDPVGFLARLLARVDELPTRAEVSARHWSRAAVAAAAALVAGLVIGLLAGGTTPSAASVDADFVASTTGSSAAAGCLPAEPRARPAAALT